MQSSLRSTLSASAVGASHFEPSVAIRPDFREASSLLTWISHNFSSDSLLPSLVDEDAVESAYSGPECASVGEALDLEEANARSTALMMEAGVLDLGSGVELISRLAASARRVSTGPSVFHARVRILQDALTLLSVCPCIPFRQIRLFFHSVFAGIGPFSSSKPSS